MRATFVSIIFAYLAFSDTLGQTTIGPCYVHRLVVVVNLMDEECLAKSETKSNNTTESENNVEVTTQIEMDSYALCLLQKSSVMNKDGEVNLNFDIVKIMKHLYKKMDARGLGLAFVIKSLERCRNLTGSNEFATASKIMKCLLENEQTLEWCDQSKI